MTIASLKTKALVVILGVGLVSSFPMRPSVHNCMKTNQRWRTDALYSETWDGKASGSTGGSIEQIEFKIFPDGRVEETVRGVKGNNCHKVTEKINEKLGEVVASSPTEEMYEQEVVVNQKIYQTNSDWEGSSSW